MYAEIVKELKRYGDVLSEHVAEETLSAFGETNMEMKELHAREIGRLARSDAVIADVTTPSLGVGYTIARALDMNKRVIALYRGEHAHKLSGMIRGNGEIAVKLYETKRDMRNVLKSELG